MEKRFGRWNVRSLYRAGSLMRGAKETSKYMFDIVEYRRSDGRGLRKLSMERGMRIMN
jgi:hypothetical protein